MQVPDSGRRRKGVARRSPVRFRFFPGVVSVISPADSARKRSFPVSAYPRNRYRLRWSDCPGGLLGFPISGVFFSGSAPAASAGARCMKRRRKGGESCDTRAVLAVALGYL